MLSREVASQLHVTGLIPKPLTNVSFAEGTHLWKKQRHFIGFNGDELTSPRHQYSKMGKTLGLETSRYLTQWMGHLFYFNGEDDEEYLGYCQLENVYVQWLPLKCQRYLLVLSNGYETSHFFFEQPTFWQQQQEEIIKYAIQLDFSQKYQIQDLLGEGSFSQVHKVHSKLTGECCAAKVISKTDKKDHSTKEMVASQRKILHIMKNQNGISKFKQFFQTNDSYVLILDYVPGTNMMNVFNEKKEIPLPKMKELFADILGTLKECHSKNIIHRDIKPHNIILSGQSFEPKLIDFGLALVTNKEMENYSYSKCGTTGYIAPQILLNDSMFYKSYGYKCDIFSFGVVAHMFLMGNNPLAGISEEQRIKNIEIQLDQKSIVEKYGQSCLKFLGKLMAANPRHRYTAEQALKSSFLQDCFDNQGSISTIESGCHVARDLRDFE